MLLGRKLLCSLLKGKDVSAFYAAKLSEPYFTGDDGEIYTYIVEHLHKHGCLPDISTVSAVFGDMPETPEPTSFYLDELEERFGHGLYNALGKAIYDGLKAKDIPAITKKVEDSLAKLKTSETRFNVLDFAAEGSKIFKLIHSQAFIKENGIKIGWDYVDSKTEGMGGGDIFTICGRPAVGKTWAGLWAAYHAYIKQDKNVVFLSMEMTKNQILQRLIGILAELDMWELKTGKLATFQLQKIHGLLDSLQSKEARLRIIDGSLKTSVTEVNAIVHQYKPELVVVDGTYLIKHPDPRIDGFKAIGENVETLKAMALHYDIPMLLSYQLNRDAAKKKEKGEDATLDNIAGSDKIGQISTVVLALNQPDSAETMNYRVVKILKGRNGEEGKFNINWNFDKLDFSEVSDLESNSSDYND